MASLSYCADQVRALDHDRYLSSLFAPPQAREHLVALYAFNSEIARAAEIVSEALLGRIRLQWWRDAIGEIYRGEPRRHAVVEALAGAVRSVGWREADLIALIEAREFDLEGLQPPTMAALEDYTRATAGGLLALALQALGCDREQAQELSVAAGSLWALSGLLRAVPYHARAKRCYLPLDRCRKAGLETALLFELKPSSALCRVVAEVATRAVDLQAKARADYARLPRQQRSPLLLSALARSDLARLSRAGHDPFAATLMDPPPGRAWRLLGARIAGL